MAHSLLRLGARLSLCASMVRPGTRLADIGTDHAYLPVWLAGQGLVSHAIAADINSLPLKSAQQNIYRYHVEDIVSPRLSNGLDAFSEEDADDIVLAGMGGELMMRIITGAPWLKSGDKHLILQPMTSAQPLRLFLAENGFSIVKEQAVCEEHHIYSVMLVVYDPSHTGSGTIYPYIGMLDASTKDNRAYLSKRVSVLEKRARGMELSGRLSEMAELQDVISKIHGMLKRNGEFKVTLIKDIYEEIDCFAPFCTAMDFDNCGLLVGTAETPVHKVIISLDITPNVVSEAAKLGAELIISHHPVIFDPLKNIPSQSAPYLLARHGISAICAHTNLDMAEGGVNTCLAARLALHNVKMLKEYKNSGLAEGLIGETEHAFKPAEFASFVKEALGCDGLKYTDGNKEISRVALCGGTGASLLGDAVKAGAHALVTADTKHNQLLDAENMGITLIDAGHFYTEDVVIQPLLEHLQKRFPATKFRKSTQMHSPAIFL